MQDTLLLSGKKVIGLKQTRRAIMQDSVKEIYLASDVDDSIKTEIIQLCTIKDIPIKALNITKQELGRLCKIDVGASIIAILKD